MSLAQVNRPAVVFGSPGFVSRV
ncbi:MAG: hypothetical protein JWQ11_146, partial [Rhizobacter sp.]|nr:hypothetical protein [Rhizobacter sp.]